MYLYTLYLYIASLQRQHIRPMRESHDDNGVCKGKTTSTIRGRMFQRIWHPVLEVLFTIPGCAVFPTV